MAYAALRPPQPPQEGGLGSLLRHRVSTRSLSTGKVEGHPQVAPKPNVTDGCVGRLLPLTRGPASPGTWGHTGPQAGPPRLFLIIYSLG